MRGQQNIKKKSLMYFVGVYVFHQNCAAVCLSV